MKKNQSNELWWLRDCVVKLQRIFGTPAIANGSASHPSGKKSQGEGDRMSVCSSIGMCVRAHGSINCYIEKRKAELNLELNLG